MAVLRHISNEREQYERYIARQRHKMDVASDQVDQQELKEVKALQAKAEIRADGEAERADEEAERADEEAERADEEAKRADEEARQKQQALEQVDSEGKRADGEAKLKQQALEQKQQALEQQKVTLERVAELEALLKQQDKSQ